MDDARTVDTTWAEPASNRFEAALKDGFVTQATQPVVREELISKYAPEWASQFAGKLSMNQLRRFFAEVKGIGERAKEGQPFERLLPRVQLVWAQAAHAAGKKSSADRVPAEFVEFVRASVQRVKTREDLDAFVAVFEAVVGHFVYAEKQREDGRAMQRGRDRHSNQGGRR